jgi:hypothetical protein
MKPAEIDTQGRPRCPYTPCKGVVVRSTSGAVRCQVCRRTVQLPS